jgi:phage terminase large subunit
MKEVNWNFPAKLDFLLQKKARYKVLYGGRGSGKSYNIAQALVIKALYEPLTIVCSRNLQKSIKDSVHKLIKSTIIKKDLGRFFEITNVEIRSLAGAQFIFQNISSNPDELKSLEDADIWWIEEAAKTPEDSITALVNTVRKKGSEIWFSFNPHLESDPVYQKYVTGAKEMLEDGISIESVLVNYYDNPFFWESELVTQMKSDKKRRPDVYQNVWLGNPIKESEALVFRGRYEVQNFDTPPLKKLFNNRFFFGADWGFNPDPCVLIRCFITDDERGRILWIDQEIYEVELQLKNIAPKFAEMQEAVDWKIKADSSRPDIIDMLKRAGFNIEGAPKTWTMKSEKGFAAKRTREQTQKASEQTYIKAGIDYMLDFDKIIIHERCKNTIVEFGLYSKKIDKISKEILPLLEDANNHCIDSIRYALSEYIKAKTAIKTINWGF